jgi:hypothetical protein
MVGMIGVKRVERGEGVEGVQVVVCCACVVAHTLPLQIDPILGLRRRNNACYLSQNGHGISQIIMGNNYIKNFNFFTNKDIK